MPLATDPACPVAKSGLWTKLTARPSSAALILSASWPVITTRSSIPPSSIACAVRRTIGTPSISTSSLLTLPMRRDMPAARTIPAISTPSGWRRSTILRGNGREAISISSPPIAISAISSSPSGIPASTRCNTQSKPFSRGDRAQPGMPITGIVPIRADISRFPGSAGRPILSTTPPASTTAAGTTSRRSLIAEAPQTRMASAPLSRAAAIASATAALSCGTSRLSTSAHPSWFSRCFVTFSVPARIEAFMPSIRVWIRAKGRAVRR